MRQKRINFVLILGVLVIWLFVFKRSFSVWGRESNVAPSSFEVKQIRPTPEFRKDTFQLTHLERDPFLEHGERKKPLVVKMDTEPKRESPIRVKNIRVAKAVWPKLQYFGFLRGDSNSERLALIKIENKLYRVREKSTVESIQVIKVCKDSVILRKNGITKIIIK